MTAHPSSFDLDLHAVGAGDDAVAAHVADCPVCQAHITQVTADRPVPDWVRALPAAPGPTAPATTDRPKAAASWFQTVALATTLALAAGLLLVPLLAPEAPDAADPSWVAAKGAPTVVAYRQRGEQVTRIAPGQSLRPGDGLRLAVASPDHRHVRVLSHDTLLFDGPIPATDDGLLPESWRVDGQSDREQLTVIFTRVPFDPKKSEPTTWKTHLVFAKERVQ